MLLLGVGAMCCWWGGGGQRVVAIDLSACLLIRRPVHPVT